jgi:hypothetical protein
MEVRDREYTCVYGARSSRKNKDMTPKEVLFLLQFQTARNYAAPSNVGLFNNRSDTASNFKSRTHHLWQRHQLQIHIGSGSTAKMDSSNISKEDVETLMLLGLGAEDNDLTGKFDFGGIHLGLEHQWDKAARVSHPSHKEQWFLKPHSRGTRFSAPT